MWRKNVATIIAGGLLAVLLVVYMSTYQVRFHEVALVKTFGRVTHTQKEPGLRWRWPWPIQQVVTYDTRVNVMEDPLSEPLTRDSKPITAQSYMAWRITEPEQFLQKVGSVSKATQQLRNILKARKEEVLSQYGLNNFVSTDPAQLKLPEVEQRLLALVRASASEYGVDVLSVGIKRLGVPGSTSEQIFNAMRGGRQELVQRYQSQGNAKATQIASYASEIRDKILAFAQLRAEQLRAEGQAAAAANYDIFKDHEDFAIFLKELGMLRQTLASNTTIMLDWNIRPFDFFSKGPSLPVTASPQPAQVMSGAAGAPSAATQPVVESR